MLAVAVALARKALNLSQPLNHDAASSGFRPGPTLAGLSLLLVQTSGAPYASLTALQCHSTVEPFILNTFTPLIICDVLMLYPQSS